MVSKKVSSEKTLECHRCWIDMQKKEIDIFGPNLIIDVCPKCNGIWLDKGELQKLLKDQQLSKYLTKHIGTKSRSPMICPKCAMTMDIEKAEDIEVDVCLTCGGVWLDQGELEGLKIKSEQGYQGDQNLKNEEILEEKLYKARTSSLNKFLRRISH